MRLVMFAAMAALLVGRAVRAGGVRRHRRCCSRCAYAVVRAAHIALFVARQPRRPGAAPLGHGPGRQHGDRRRAAGRRLGRRRRARRARCGRSRWRSTWAARCFFGSEGWKLVPGHFAERHGLIVIIALGESIVAIGVGAEAGVDAGVVVAAVLGIAVAAALWWLYFDVVALVAERRLAQRGAGQGAERDRARLVLATCTSRWSPASCCVALGMKKTLGARRGPARSSCRRSRCSAARRSTCSRTSRSAGATSTRSTASGSSPASVLLVALIPLGVELPALATLAILAAVLAGLIVYEAMRFAEAARPAAPPARALGARSRAGLSWRSIRVCGRSAARVARRGERRHRGGPGAARQRRKRPRTGEAPDVWHLDDVNVGRTRVTTAHPTLTRGDVNAARRL